MSTFSGMPTEYSRPKSGPTLFERMSMMSPQWWRVVFASVGFIGLGLFMLWEYADTDHTEIVSLTALENGKMPTAKMVKVSGYLLKDESAIEIDDASITHFVPIVSHTREPGDRCAAVARMSEYEFEQFGDFGPVEGVMKTFRLGSGIRDLIENVEPHVTLADSYILIEHGVDPVSMNRFGFVVIAIGSALLGLCALAMYTKSGEDTVDKVAGDRALRAAVSDGSASKLAARASSRDMSDCDDAVRQWCQSNGFSGYQER